MHGVGGGKAWAVVDEPLGDGPNGRIEQVGSAGDGGGLPGVALVVDPHVPVVVVAAGLRPFGVAAATMPPPWLVKPRSTA
ncbi:hypothetical protein ACFTY8_40500 [Streptomyces mirabilis]|uniref:hypothetical protein n=1 Tax=Streptomyces mirabilis TaxID=68239 RepID=UPI00363D2CEA